MMKSARLIGMVVVAVSLLSGCATSSLTTVTNLTPSRLPRKDNGQYPFSVEFHTRQRTLVRETLKAYVVIGDDKYPMEQTPLLRDRFETLIPVPANQDVVTYRYRFEYEYKAIPERKADLFDSRGYQLYITVQ